MAADPVRLAEADIRASRSVNPASGSLSVGRSALHSARTPGGRYAFFASLDGWITKFDTVKQQVAAEVRTGFRTRDLALSGDGKYLAVANDLPTTLVLLDADLNPLRVHAVKDNTGKTGSRVAALQDAAPRKSFVAALKDVPEVWEISYDPGAEDIAVGMVHDFQYQEGAFARGYLNPRRTFLAEPLDEFFLSTDCSELMAPSREAGKLQIVNLDVRRKIAELPVGSVR
ncbi:MAG: hypothetical protein HYX46_14290 [Betaproteobacteria bacterium]|nr:hypothetical protein [Betaproteobacteria bacterium]